MPLKDHFHPPWSEQNPGDGFHSAWANSMVRYLNLTCLPRRYRAVPQVHLGPFVETDLATFDQETLVGSVAPATQNGDGGQGATEATWWASPQAVQTLEVELPAQDVFEVRVHDEKRGMRLVAVVELVSPGNKDRPENRQAFATKCAAYLQDQVNVVMVDVVVTRHASLHRELLATIAPHSPCGGDAELYAVAYHNRKEHGKWRLDYCPFALAVGSPLPTVPLWLASNLSVPLDLEGTYEETCRVLRIGNG